MTDQHPLTETETASKVPDEIVEAWASHAWATANTGIPEWNSLTERHREGCRQDARAVLTADDLRHTDAGKQLLAEGWDAAWKRAWGPAACELTPNPYRESAS